MKKIMFDNHYGLEDAVLNGTKTMTRRIIPCKVCQDILPALRYAGLDVSHDDMVMQHARYKVGEIVAIAQSYICFGDFYYHGLFSLLEIKMIKL